MRLNNFLWESKEIFWEKEKDMDKIYTNCSEIVKIYKKTNEFFYRGLKYKPGTKNKMIRKKPRKLRRPRDTSIEAQKAFDKYMLEKFGWKPRAQGVFATSDFYDAEGYGGGHIIFPYDGFEYIWSPKMEDAYSDILEDYGYYGEWEWTEKYEPDSGKGYWKHGKKTIKKLEQLPDYWDEYEDNESGDDYKYSNTVMFSKEQREDMIDREEKWEWIPDVSYKEYAQEKFEKELSSYTNKGIEKCLKSPDGNEIMILCQYYYAIPIDEGMSPKEFGL